MIFTKNHPCIRENMFESYDDIDVNDEFLNIVFEQEEGDNNNEIKTNGKASSVKLRVPSTIERCTDNEQDRLAICNFSETKCDLPSGIPENPFDEFSYVQQEGNHNVGGKENKRKTSPPLPRSKRERRFPGPAGLLPDRKSLGGIPLELDGLPQVDSPAASAPDELCSQGRLSGSILEEGPWQSFLSDLGPHVHVLEVVNVASVKRKAAGRCFVGRKVPFLAAVLHHLDLSSADPCIILRDSTGEIHGTLHREVWQQFAAELVVGSVLVIRNVGLLSTGLSSRRHYLNITANNLVTIYSANPDKPLKRELHSLTSHDYIRTIEHWQSLVAPVRNVGSPASLFNTSFSSPSTSSPVQSPRVMRNLQPQPSGPMNSSLRLASQNMQGRVIPPSSRANAILRPTKNLFTSCSNTNNANQALTSNSNTMLSSLSGRNCSGVDKPDTNVGRNNLNSSLPCQSAQKPCARNMQNLQKSSPSFKFNPAFIKNKTNHTVRLPQNNFENLSTVRSGSNEDCGRSLGKNGASIILSQPSQLTVEEQSVVESVFDGIDADSLFDDDF